MSTSDNLKTKMGRFRAKLKERITGKESDLESTIVKTETKKCEDAKLTLKDLNKRLDKEHKTRISSISDGRGVGESFASFADISKESFPNLVDFSRTIMKYTNQLQQLQESLDLSITTNVINKQKTFISEDVKEIEKMKLNFDDKRRDLDLAMTNERNEKQGKSNKEKIERAERELSKAKEAFEFCEKAYIKKLLLVNKKHELETLKRFSNYMESYKKFFDEGSKLTNEIVNSMDTVKQMTQNALESIEESSKETKIFCVDFRDLVERDKRVPKFLYLAFEFLEKYALKQEGIFRVNGNLNAIEGFVKKLDQGIVVNFESLDIVEHTLHDVAGLVKYYFRQLPEPLIMYNAFDEIIKTADMEDPELKLNQLKKGIEMLPKENISLLRRVLELFRNIEKNKEDNKMTFSNCATVIAPTLMSSKSDDPMMMIKVTKNINAIFEFLLISYEKIFPTGIWDACKNGDLNLLKECVDKFGFGVNGKDEEGKTGLHHSTINSQKEIVKFLIFNDISAEVQDNRGNTALHYAVENKNEEIITILLEYNNTIAKLENKKGETALKNLEQNLPELYLKLVPTLEDSSSFLFSPVLPRKDEPPSPTPTHKETTPPPQPKQQVSQENTDSFSLLEELEKTAYNLVNTEPSPVPQKKPSPNDISPNNQLSKSPPTKTVSTSNNINLLLVTPPPTSKNQEEIEENDEDEIDMLLEETVPKKKEEPQQCFSLLKLENLNFYVDPSVEVLWTLEPLPITTNDELIDAILIFASKLLEMEFGNHQTLGFGAALKNLASGIQSFLKEIQFISDAIPEQNANDLRNSSLDLKNIIKNIIPHVQSLRDIINKSQTDKLLYSKKQMQEQILLMANQTVNIYTLIKEGQEANINNHMKLVTEAVGSLVKLRKTGGNNTQALQTVYEQIINNSFITCQFVVSTSLASNIREFQQDLIKEISAIANAAVAFESNMSHTNFDPSPHVKKLLTSFKQIKMVLSKQSIFAETLTEREVFEECNKEFSLFKFLQSELSRPTNNLQGDLMGLTNKFVDCFGNAVQKLEDKPTLFKTFEEMSSLVNKLSGLITRVLKFNKDGNLRNRLTAYNDSLLFHLRESKLSVVQCSYSYHSHNVPPNFGRILSGLTNLVMQIIFCVYYSCGKK